MATKVCSKSGITADEPKPMKCAKCGSRDFYESQGSAFGKKSSDPCSG